MRREKMLKADMQNDGQGVSYKRKKMLTFYVIYTCLVHDVFMHAC